MKHASPYRCSGCGASVSAGWKSCHRGCYRPTLFGERYRYRCDACGRGYHRAPPAPDGRDLCAPCLAGRARPARAWASTGKWHLVVHLRGVKALDPTEPVDETEDEVVSPVLCAAEAQVPVVRISPSDEVGG